MVRMLKYLQHYSAVFRHQLYKSILGVSRGVIKSTSK